MTPLCLVTKNDYIIARDLTIFPNPTTGNFTIQNATLIFDHIELYNLLGEKMPAVVVDNRLMTIDCRLLPPGIYFVKAVAGEKVLFGKVIKESTK